MSWSKEQAAVLGKAEGLKIAPLREDGKTPGTPTFIWDIILPAERGGGRLFVRAYNGVASRWHQAALRQKAGEIHAASGIYKVRFAPVSDEALNAAIDKAYQAKYGSSPYCPAMISARARAATVEILPV